MQIREPLVLPVAAIGIGIVLAHLWPLDSPPLIAAALTLALLTAAALVRNIRFAGLAACLIGFVASGALLEMAHVPPPAPHLDVPDLSMTILTGCVVDPPALTGDHEQFVLQLAPHVRARVSMFARPGESLPHISYGQLLDVEGRLRSPRNFGNPESFDYRNYLARQNVYWSLSAQNITPLKGQCGNFFDRAVSHLRTGALDRIASLYNNDRYNTAMMDAVLIGEGSGLERVWTEQYRSTGTFHALIISGSHVAILAGVFLFLLRICFLPRVPAIFLTVGAAWLYAVVTGWQAPVIRSAAGMSLFAIGSLFFRERRMLNLLAAVALLFLLFDPDQLFDPSFQLSFLAVAFLAVFAIPLIERTTEPVAQALRDLHDDGRDIHLPARVASYRIELRLLADTASAITRLPQRASQTVICLLARAYVFFFDLFITSAVIQAGLALPMAIYFHRVSFTGLSANAVVVPLLGLVVPIGFAALFTNSHWIARLAAVLLDLSRRTVDWHARFEPNWRIPSPPLLLSFVICILLALAAIRWKRTWITWAASIALVASLVVLIVSPFPPHLSPRTLEMTAIDVGQGDSILLTLPDGKIMLVDAGGIPHFNHRESPTVIPVRMEIGEDVVAPYLWTRAIRKLDVVAISHLHDDHVGGLPAILNDFQVTELWVGATPPCPQWDAIQAKAKERGTRIRHLHRGEQIALGESTFDVLAPAVDYLPASQPGNNDSLVFRVAYKERSFLLTGDMEKPVELDVASASRWPHADVLKVGHHGSKSSSTSEFLDQVRPVFAVMSDGYGNLYGHPHPITLESLAARHVLAYRTDRDGLVSIRTDGHRIWRE